VRAVEIVRNTTTLRDSYEKYVADAKAQGKEL
jgi:hypothetical protein